MDTRTGGGRAHQWVRGEGTVDEVGEVISAFLGDEVPANPIDVHGQAMARLHGRLGNDRVPGRALLWAAANMGSRQACLRLAEEIEAALGRGDDPSHDVDPQRAIEIAEQWRLKSRGKINLTALARKEARRLEFAPPFPSGSGLKTGAATVQPAGPAKKVIRSIGDVSSPDGVQLLSRFASVVDVPLPAVGSIPPPGVVASRIAAEWPWATHVGDLIERRLSLLRSAGMAHSRLHPLLLVGPPGAGKTKLLRHVATSLGLPATIIPAAGSSDAASLSAVTRDWRNTRPCGPVIAAIEAGCSNPAIVIDEIDKGVAAGNRNGSVIGAILGMIGEAERYFDACLMSEVDLSWVSFMATANDLSTLPAPLLDRFEIVHVGRPRIEHLSVILANLRIAEARTLGIHPGLLPELDEVEERVLRVSFTDGMSLRSLERAHRLLLGEAAKREAENTPN